MAGGMREGRAGLGGWGTNDGTKCDGDSSTLSERLWRICAARCGALHCDGRATRMGWMGGSRDVTVPLPRQPGRRCAKCGSDGSDGQLAAARYRVLGMGDGVVRPNLVIYSPGCGWPRRAVRIESLLSALRSDMDAAQTCIITPDAIEDAGDEAVSCLVCGRERASRVELQSACLCLCLVITSPRID